MPRSVAVQVSDADVSALQREYRPGAVVPYARLFDNYVSMLRQAGRQAASSQALSRALTRAGWQRQVIRKRRGPLGDQRVVSLVTVRIAPGSVPIHEEDDRMVTVLRALLQESDRAEDNYIPQDRIWGRYQELGRQKGWRWSMSRSQVTRWLNDHGFPAAVYGGVRGPHGRRGKPSRYVTLDRLDMIAPLR